MKLGEGGVFLDAGLTDACQFCIFTLNVLSFTSLLSQFNKMMIFFFQKYTYSERKNILSESIVLPGPTN